MRHVVFILLAIYLTIAVDAQSPQRGGITKKIDCRLDSDQDGISDCFDQCPDTPKEARVDAKGCPRDTDGDGIPDYKDKELITPTECQPSDTNGVGNCKQYRK